MKYLSLIIVTAMTLFAQVASADEIYSYIGNAYNLCDGSYASGLLFIPSCKQTFSVHGSFTTSLSLPELENLFNFIIPASDITAFLFTDGSGDFITQSNATSSLFQISTDASGNMTLPDWNIALSIPGFQIHTASCLFDHCVGSQDWSASSIFQNSSGALGYGQTPFEDPGRWSEPIDPGISLLVVPTPEPGTLLLFGSGILCLYIVLRKLVWRSTGAR